MKIPTYLSKYFWDVKIGSFNKGENPTFILERILEYGDEKAVKWLTDNFNLKDIKETVCKSRKLSPKSANYWVLILGLDKRRIRCLQKSFIKRRQRFWPY